ncbi:TolC family protein [Calditrichota bacterium]
MSQNKYRSVFLPFMILVFVLFISDLCLAQKLLSFEETMNIARTNSPDILQAKLNLERSQESLKAQNASLKSQFRLTVEPFRFDRAREFSPFFSTWNTSETKQSSGLFSITQPIIWTDGTLSLMDQITWRDSYSEFQDTRTKTYSNNLYLSYQQPIFTFNRTKLELREVELDLENSLLSYRMQGLRLEQQVAGSFYSAFQRKMSLQVSKEEYANTEQTFQITKNKVDAGLERKEELYQQELNLTSSKSNIQNDQVQLENALDELKQLIGLPLFDDIDIVAETSQESIEADLEIAINYGLKNRMELRQRNINIETSKANLIRAAATNEFKGNINLSYGFIGNDEKFENIYDKPTENQQVNLSLEIPIWDWGESEARTKAAEASVSSSRMSLEEEKNNIIIGIRKAFRNLQNQEIQIDIARQNVNMAQLTYDINLERYKNGDLTSMDLNQFQNQLSQKKIGLVNALINYKIALLDLKIQSLWDFERNESVLKDLDKYN